MARRAFLHLGTPKSGTTYLQSLWWQQREELQDQGLLLLGPSKHSQFNASAVIRGNRQLLDTMTPQQQGAWDRFLRASAAWDGDVLLSQEHLVATPADRAAAAVAAMAEAAEEVHVVVTARDLARQIPSAWQQRVKHGSPVTLEEFCTRVAEDDAAFNFWRYQDVPRILSRWSKGLAPEQVHVVPLPRPGGPRDLLWRRVSDLLGLDADALSASAPMANESLAPEKIEFLRRVNAEFPEASEDVIASRHLRRALVTHLVGTGERPRSLTLSPKMQQWAAERSDRMVEQLRAAEWDVVGDLDDLRSSPTPADGVDPATVQTHDVLDVAVTAVATLVRESRPEAAGRPSDSAAGSVAAPGPTTDRTTRGRSGPVRKLAGRLVRRLRDPGRGQRGTNAQ